MEKQKGRNERMGGQGWAKPKVCEKQGLVAAAALQPLSLSLSLSLQPFCSSPPLDQLSCSPPLLPSLSPLFPIPSPLSEGRQTVRCFISKKYKEK